MYFLVCHTIAKQISCSYSLNFIQESTLQNIILILLGEVIVIVLNHPETITSLLQSYRPEWLKFRLKH